MFMNILTDPQRKFTDKLNDEQKGLFLMLFLLMGFFKNNIPNDPETIRRVLNLSEKNEKISENLKKIFDTFPRGIRASQFIKFKDYNMLHNPIGKSQNDTSGTPKDALEKRRVEKIREEYIRANELDPSLFVSGDYARISKGIKNLVERAGGQDEMVIEGIRWISKQGYTWTLETLLRKWPDFLKNYNKDKGVRELEKLYKSTPKGE